VILEVPGLPFDNAGKFIIVFNIYSLLFY